MWKLREKEKWRTRPSYLGQPGAVVTPLVEVGQSGGGLGGWVKDSVSDAGGISCGRLAVLSGTLECLRALDLGAISRKLWN